jgi:hypothetical protein
MNWQQVLALTNQEDLFNAVVTVDDGPGTSAEIILNALWATGGEARGHVERRMPELHVEYRLPGRRVRAVVCSAQAGVRPDRHVIRDGQMRGPAPWVYAKTAAGVHAEIRDGKVIGWAD